MNKNEVSTRHCVPCEGGGPALTEGEVACQLVPLKDWKVTAGKLEKVFSFRNHYEAMAFVNAVAWVSHREDHHPELTVGYRDVQVSYWTHAINGLSENDFICAEKLDKLLAL